MSRRASRKKRIEAAKTKPAPVSSKEIRAAGGPVKITAEAGSDGVPKMARFEGRGYTGAPMTPPGWGPHPLIIDLDGMEVPSQHRPILHQHDHTKIVGHTESVKVKTGIDGGIDVAGPFSGEDHHVKEITGPASRGFEWQMSIGCEPKQMEFLEAGNEAEVNGRAITGPMQIARKSVLGEVSFVPLGADGDTSATVSASRGRCSMFTAMLKAAKKAGNILAGKYNDDEIEKMSEDNAKAALKKCMKAEEDDEKKAKAGDDEEDDDEKKAKAEEEKDKKTEASGRTLIAQFKAEMAAEFAKEKKVQVAELRRQSEIKARCQKYPGIQKITVEGKEVDLIPHAIENDWTADKAELEAMRSARPGPGVGFPGGLAYSTSAPELSEAVIEAGVLQCLRHTYHLENGELFTERFEDGSSRPRPKLDHIKAEVDRELKSRYPDKVQQAAHTFWKGRKLTFHEVMDRGFSMMAGTSNKRRDWKSESGIKAANQEWAYHEQQNSIQAEGSSTMSISNILANVLNKFALQGYLFVEQVWRQICGIRPVNDFKPTKSINLLGDVMFKALGPTGELVNASLGDQAFANIAQPFGRITTIPWTHIVNDDLSILQTVPQKLGQGAGTAINDFVWSLASAIVSGSVAAAGAAGNPNGVIPSAWNLNADDGNAFFRTTTSLTLAAGKAGTAYNKNKATGGGTALSATSLQTAKALFDNQVDPNMNPLGFEGVKPVLLIGPSNWQTAKNLLQADLIVSGNTGAAGLPNKNAWNNFADLAVSRYMENALYLNNTTAWMLFYNPITIAALEVCFLNGVDTPAVLQAGPDYQFDRPGISIRGTMPFGVNQQNFRAAYYMAGA